MTNTNLAPIFQNGILEADCNWADYDGTYLYYGDFVPAHQIMARDDTVTHLGHPSIVLHQQNEYNPYREINGEGIYVQPGDVVRFKVYVKTAAGTGNAAIIGFDVYGSSGGTPYRILEIHTCTPQPAIWNIVNDVPTQGGTNLYVPYGSDWTLLELKVTIPSTFYTHSDTGASIPSQQISGLIPWMGGVWNGRADYPDIWFADAELYVNPTGETIPVFGFDEIGAAEDTQPTGYMSKTWFEAPTSGTINTVTMYCKTANASGKVRVYIYDNSNDLLATSNEETVGTSYSWVTFTLPSPLAVTQGVTYGFGEMSDYTLYVATAVGTENQWEYDGAGALTYPTPPDPFAPDGYEWVKGSIYATYQTQTFAVAKIFGATYGDLAKINKTAVANIAVINNVTLT